MNVPRGNEMIIDRESPIPLYRQVESVLREKILIGEFKNGDLLPSEAQLCDLYNVSRITIRQALDELNRNGMISRIQGKGTTVKELDRKPFNVTSATGFKKSISDETTKVRSEILSIDTIAGDSTLLEVFHLLSVDRESEFLRIRRLRYINDVPSVIMTSFIRKEVGEKMLEFDLSTASFYELIESIVGLKIIYNKCTFIPVTATPELCTLLKVRPGSSHFYYRGISYTEGDIPVELANGYYHGDKFELTTTIHRIRIIEDEIAERRSIRDLDFEGGGI